ncbi:hypothetical protein BpHYR1_028992 [Brachionus plicatilis]|uniref:Uncharacterized protein n=1 Tax=Brachionus plicatilis TaxID=10195 RepID=A0A3M7RNF9_BRAPC|nr:hypothetical protein BpHYR1_028992 [Brachionus plicatilis]
MIFFIYKQKKIFKLYSVNATLCNIQSCIKYQGLLNLQSSAEIKFKIIECSAFCRDFAHH